MPRVLAVAVLVLATLACLAPSANAESLYRGRGPGIRVEFRVRHGEVYFSRVRTSLKCIRQGRRGRARFGRSLGSISIRDGLFQISDATEEPGYGAELLLSGAVHPQEITGRFWYQRYYGHHSVCQTRHYQSMAIRHLGRDSLRFWATRRPVHSRTRR